MKTSKISLTVITDSGKNKQSDFAYIERFWNNVSYVFCISFGQKVHLKVYTKSVSDNRYVHIKSKELLNIVELFKYLDTEYAQAIHEGKDPTDETGNTVLNIKDLFVPEEPKEKKNSRKKQMLKEE